MSTLEIKVNDRPIKCESGQTILDVLEQHDIYVPTLCHVEGLEPTGSCRMCVVEVEGRGTLVPSCAEPIQDQMAIHTNSSRVMNARRQMVQLLLANHPDDCLYCARGGDCTLQDLAVNAGIRERLWRKGSRRTHPMDRSSPSVVRDPNKCILCGKCVRVCDEVQDVGAIDHANRGFDSMVLPAFDDELASTACVNCGQCVAICPTGALTERIDLPRVWRYLEDEQLTTVVQVAPAVRAALAYAFDLPVREAEGKMVSALREMGFDQVFDTQFTADLTIMEEGSELLERIQSDQSLPLITSCSPGWIKYCEHFYPEFLPHLSSCKSPQQMMGAMIKSYWAQQAEIDSKDVRVVAVMPCTAKKYEAERPEMETESGRDVDAVITTRELIDAIEEMGVVFSNLPEDQFDDFLGASTGAGAIFGATGGVAEAALRTVYYLVEGENPDPEAFSAVRGLDGVKKVELTFSDGTVVRGAVVHGLSNARQVMEEIQSGEADYAFIEVMACPGGCVGGGGQPYNSDTKRVAELARQLYQLDEQREMRFSHENPEIQRLYEEYLGAPLSERCHELLHTEYQTRSRYPKISD